MASDVDICNLALAALGNDASVATIDPPEGSTEAEHCARFYPMARNAILERHDWNFATSRVALQQLTNTRTEWAYCYARPNAVARIVGVIASDASSDYLEISSPVWQPFVCETLTDGTPVIYTNQEDAHARYTALVVDTARFSPLFVIALTHLLASYLAGPLIKGSEGRAAAMSWLKFYESVSLPQAITSDANQRRVDTSGTTMHVPSWIAAR
jgi:hypothetical protein